MNKQQKLMYLMDTAIDEIQAEQGRYSTNLRNAFYGEHDDGKTYRQYTKDISAIGHMLSDLKPGEKKRAQELLMAFAKNNNLYFWEISAFEQAKAFLKVKGIWPKIVAEVEAWAKEQEEEWKQ